MITEDQKVELIAVAHQLADAAAEVSLLYFRKTDLIADNKAGGRDFDPVTKADRAAERAMRAILEELRPDDGILGEEEAEKPSRSGITWVLDPIDGTRAFISGLPVWGTLIAVNAGDGPQIGIIDQPYIGERFFGTPGRAEHIHRGNKRPISVRDCADLGHATLFSTFPEIGSERERDAFQSVSQKCRLTRYGTDCYAYGLLAMGQIDLVIEAGLNAYDIQAPIAVIEAAGGIVTDWSGGPVWQGGRAVAAGDARTHAQALALLRDA